VEISAEEVDPVLVLETDHIFKFKTVRDLEPESPLADLMESASPDLMESASPDLMESTSTV
jgi:hypothetical protein